MTVLTFGETMALNSATNVGPLAHTREMKLGIGGAESNFAIALARLGNAVTWVGRVGTDSFGDLVERELRAEGVGLVIIRDSTAPTGLMIKERRTATASRIWYYRKASAGSNFSIGDISESLLADASILHVTGITPALSESALEATLHYVDRARAEGIDVSFDLNYRQALWTPDQARPIFRRIIEQSSVVFAGADEATIAVGEGNPTELAQRISDLGPAEVVIKLGEHGALLLADGHLSQRAAIPVAAIDTVGAGDGFVAGYISEREAGSSVDQRLRTANSVGAFACTVDGDWEGMPRRSELPLLTDTEPVIR
ncbi:sugar kinase [Rhodococcus erythropolis]|uniref:sugar kinase n=1 Tax=Rhodococcus erythropolis TaxID=1833 RepID=UPI00378A827B